MLTLGPLAFLNPWLLAPLAALPVLWWLLRLTPPAPRKVLFPAIRILMGIRSEEETPAHTPWWLLLLRCLIVAAILTGLAQPILNPSQQLSGTGPLLLVIDDGWSAGPAWVRTQSQASALLQEAARSERPVRLLFTAPRADGQPTALSDVLRASDARQQISSHLPSPWPLDRQAAVKALEGADKADVIYFSDGVDSAGANELMAKLASLGPAVLHRPAGGRLPLVLTPPELTGEGLMLTINRAGPLPATEARLRATAADGRLLANDSITLPQGQIQVKHVLRLPAELRNAVTRLELEGESSAGAVVLLDANWRRRPVGIVAGSGADKPLVGESFYLQRALKPYAELRQGELDTLLTQGISLLVLADVGGLDDTQQKRLREWMQAGGVLLRFAGPTLAAHADALLPVKLRGGERALDGALSWSEPLPIRSFTPTSPFVGLAIPADVTIRKQVLAEPAPDLAAKSWVTLADGTPLVTGESIGKGWLVLVHTTANADWSNLPLSGLYVEMLRRVLELSSGLAAQNVTGALLPIEVLGGLGQMLAPAPTVQPLEADKPAQVSAIHPPGFYGQGGMRVALNLSGQLGTLMPLPAASGGMSEAQTSREGSEISLMPWLLAAALLLLALDQLIVLRLRGALAPALALLLFIAMPAQANEQEDMQRAQDVWLAYVITGDGGVDSTSHAGLTALNQTLTARTSIEPGGVVGVDLEQDDLSLYPLLYWPVTPSQSQLSTAARERINAYLRHGGMILFDTMDGHDGMGANDDLIRLSQGLDLPPLAPIKPDHVLTRSFFLINTFPGSYPVNTLWLDADPERRNDSVSSIIVGGGNWAAAWAAGGGGGRESARGSGHEMARRFGVNVVMYALAGNYKSDQIHVQTILERLGQ